MYGFNKMDPRNLDYIEKQVRAIKETHQITNKKEEEELNKVELEDMLEEQLLLLKQIKISLAKIETATTTKWWKKLF